MFWVNLPTYQLTDAPYKTAFCSILLLDRFYSYLSSVIEIFNIVHLWKFVGMWWFKLAPQINLQILLTRLALARYCSLRHLPLLYQILLYYTRVAVNGYVVV